MQGRAQAMDDGGGVEEAQYVFGHIERHEYLQQAVRFPNTTQPCVSLPRCEHVRLRKKQKLLHVFNCLLGPASVLFTVVAAVGCNGNGC
jgi:hypothetical protein